MTMEACPSLHTALKRHTTPHLMFTRVALHKVTTGIATAAVAGGVVVLSSCNRSRSQNDAASSRNGVVPTLQAVGRALNLAQTVVLMTMDYKLGALGSFAYGDDEKDAERAHWETESMRRRRDLTMAQEMYTHNSHPDLEPPERLKKKRSERQAMLDAAQALAEAEELLVKLGSRQSKIHEKAAKRLLKLCQENRGVYIKVGQHISNLDYLVPTEYIQVLSQLFDNNPATSFADVREVIQEDLGKYPEDLFDSIDPEPIASASLAQVHVAYEKGTGRKLAIKVQHRGLRETSVGDTTTLVTVVRLAERMFESFSFGWLADEIAPLLPKELDFVNEGRNVERASKHMSQTGLACVIPRVLSDLSSSRVLTMEFEEGFKPTDLVALEQAGLDKRDVARLISSVFSSQVFLSSWVHCDPHPANVLLRSRNGKPQVVLLDHGLYRELDDDFRRQYARLWKSMMLADLGGIKTACQELGVEKAYPLLSAMLTARPFDEMIERSKTGSLRSSSRTGSRADQVVIRGYAQRFIQEIFELLGKIPHQMLLLLKMNDCLRHIDYSLGSPTNTMVICGEYAARSLYLETQKNNTSIWDKFGAWWSYMRVLLRIQVHDLTVWWLNDYGRCRVPKI